MFKAILCNVAECECGDCGEPVELKLPARGRFGEYAHSVVSYLRYERNMPLNDIRELLKHLYGFETTEATLLAMSERTADEFEPVYGEIRESVRHAGVAHGDETGWRVDGGKFWAWVFATQMAAFFHIDKSRGKKVVEEQMAGFSGTMVTDDWKAYIGLERQQCRAHVMRRAKRLVENREYGAKPLREGLARLYEKALNGAALEELLRGVDKLCDRRGSKDVRKFMGWLQGRKSQLFVFVTDPRVPPDNNHAERLIRPVVLNRKITGGHRSERGARSFAIMKSAMATMRLQEVDVLGGVCGYLAGRMPAGFLSPAPES
jgi:transposase